MGIWGLALKVLSPGHPPLPSFAVTRYAVLVPSDAADGHAEVIYASEIVAASTGYPVVGGALVIGLKPPSH